MGNFDHLAIAARTLGEGVAFVESLLGVPLEPGGKHPLMGTHNQLLSLGPDAYLEVIAIDPQAPVPAHPRWFALDTFDGDPALRAWIVQVEDLDAALTLAPKGIGNPADLARGDLHWRMAIPADGRLPFDGLSPALIAWQGSAHPAARLPDRGIRLSSLRLTHPQPEALRAAVHRLCTDTRIQITAAPHPSLSAVFETKTGRKILT